MRNTTQAAQVGRFLSGSDPHCSHLLHNHRRLTLSPRAFAPARQNNPAFIAHISKCVSLLPEYLNNFMSKIFVQIYHASLTQGCSHIHKLSLTNPYPAGILPGRHLRAFDCFIHLQTTEVTASYSDTFSPVK